MMYRSVHGTILSILCFAVPLLFTLSCININMPQSPADNKTSQVNQSTTPPTTELPIIEAFSASPESLSEGGSATLSWSVINANAITITPNIGNVSATGSKTIKPSTATTYTLVASNAVGMQSKTVFIQILTIRKYNDLDLIEIKKPDLIIEEIKVNSNTRRPWCIVRNIGTEFAKASGVALWVNGSWQEGQLLPAIEPGKYWAIYFGFQLSDKLGVTNNVMVVVDPEKEINELNESNNSMTIVYTAPH
jgi:hypothetical protein